jgi:hypothetical protein
MKARIKSERIVWAELYTFMYGGGRDPEPPQISSSTKGSGPASGFFNRPPISPGKTNFVFWSTRARGFRFYWNTHTHTHTPFVRGVVCLSGFRSLFICYFFTLSMAGVVVVVVIKSIRELYSSSSLFTGMGTFLEFAQLCCVPQEREKKSGASLPPGERQRKVNAVCNGNTRARNFGTITPRRCRNPSLSLSSLFFLVCEIEVDESFDITSSVVFSYRFVRLK